MADHRKRQHRHRRGKVEQPLRQRADQVERDRGNDGGRDGRDINVVVRGIFLKFKFVMLARLQAPFAGEVRIFFADIVESARQHDCGQAAKHHRRQNLCKQIALLLVKDLRIADGKRDRSLAHATGHDRDHDKKNVW